MQGARVKATIEVSWNLDVMPGWNHSVVDVPTWLTSTLERQLDHYDMEVNVRKVQPVMVPAVSE